MGYAEVSVTETVIPRKKGRGLREVLLGSVGRGGGTLLLCAEPHGSLHQPQPDAEELRFGFSVPEAL